MEILLILVLLLPFLLLGVAAPEYGTMTFRSAKRTMHKEFYFSDVVAGRLNFDAGDGAGSATPEYWIPPVPVVLIDISLKTGGTDTKKMQMTVAGQATGDYFTHANHLDTLPKRVPISIPLPAGIELAFIQRA